MAEDVDSGAASEGTVRLVATWPRWGLITAGGVAIVVLGIFAYLRFAHSTKTLSDFTTWIIVAAVLHGLLTLAMLRGEEARVARELRTARTGTPVIRGMVVQRRQKLPLFMRLLSTTLGTSAVMIADGDRSAALDALAQNSPFLRGGRLERLRAILDADIERSSGSAGGLERCIAALRELPRSGHRETDRYRTHVLVKAVLQKGDVEDAQTVLDALEKSPDDEERLYCVWLRTWYDIDEGAPLTEGDLRLAALHARAHGADDLVAKLDERIANLQG